MPQESIRGQKKARGYYTGYYTATTRQLHGHFTSLHWPLHKQEQCQEQPMVQPLAEQPMVHPSAEQPTVPPSAEQPLGITIGRADHGTTIGRADHGTTIG